MYVCMYVFYMLCLLHEYVYVLSMYVCMYVNYLYKYVYDICILCMYISMYV